MTRRRRLLFALVLAGVVLVSAELAARVYWWRRGVPFAAASRDLVHVFYPELRGLDDLAALPAGHHHVLLLGASVLNRDYGSVQGQLVEEFARRHGESVEVYDLAVRGHSTLDSLRKLQRVARLGFDAVLVYHGINEVRANNCPPEMFRADYRHYAWYQELHLAQTWANPVTVLPFTGQFAFNRIAQALGWRVYVPPDNPRYEWLARAGDEVRTAAPFADNLREICRLAAAHGSRVLLSTFALHVPVDYSLERFQRRELDYARHTLPLEVWGDPAFVVEGVAAHNRAVRAVASEAVGVELVDVDGQMPRGGAYFNDPCHLTHRGCTAFVDLVLPALERALRP